MQVSYIDVADLVELAHESAMLADTKVNNPKSRPNSSSSYLPAVAVASLLHAQQSF
jgi:hypothetical protein